MTLLSYPLELRDFILSPTGVTDFGKNLTSKKRRCFFRKSYYFDKSNTVKRPEKKKALQLFPKSEIYQWCTFRPNMKAASLFYGFGEDSKVPRAIIGANLPISHWKEKLWREINLHGKRFARYISLFTPPFFAMFSEIVIGTRWCFFRQKQLSAMVFFFHMGNPFFLQVLCFSYSLVH